jgi:glutamine synthetase
MSDTLARVSVPYDLRNIDQGERVMAEYIWIDNSGIQTRSKTRILDFYPKSAEELPEWTYDGSSTMQAPTENSEVLLKPVKIFKDPLRRGNNVLVMCETFTRPTRTSETLIPCDTNFRHFATKVNEEAAAHEPWCAIEQEYTLFNGFHELHRWPLGWPTEGYPPPQGKYYCGAGYTKAPGRVIVEDHLRACLYAGITLSGMNIEVMPGQFEFQVGPLPPVDLGDHLWVARYLLERIAEEYRVQVSFHPKPIPGDWNGAGCHLNYSTKEMRVEGGMKAIEAAVEKLGKKHKEHIAIYGEGNAARLTGAHETCSIEEFKWGVADRGVSIRVPLQTAQEGKGYLEDRRPASNVDPYVACAAIVNTTCLDNDKTFNSLMDHVNAWRLTQN